MMGSRYAPRFGVSIGLGILRESWKALTQSNMEFPEVFEDYEKYHSAVNTGNLSRARLVEDWIEPGATVLDVGVGDGTVSNYLIKNKNVKVTGLDISATACEKARQLGIATEIRDITNGLGLSDDTFYEYILLLEVIEHTAYPQRILNDAIDHATKGVIVTIPNSAYIKWRIQMLRGYVPRQSFTHLHFWSVKDFEIFCKEANIKILEFRTFLPNHLMKFKNLLAWQQCWLLSPKRNNNHQ
ncbi:MAG: methionine biosynthesis protein MetW [Nitrososphaeraceae archaeon]|nr:methionine biosynthesis protein MetW [Nitrososphaeraceae archaeon]